MLLPFTSSAGTIPKGLLGHPYPAPHACFRSPVFKSLSQGAPTRVSGPAPSTLLAFWMSVSACLYRPRCS